jgi:hypothetical protein
MRLLHPVLASTLVFGSLLTIGCSEHRYSGYSPYYGNAGYYGWNAAEDPYYRQWLAERQYNYIEYNRLDRERQREYWEWRNANAARFRNDPRFRNNQVVRNNELRNDHDRDDRWNRNQQVARERDGDRDRHRADRDRHQVRNNNKDRDKDRDHDHDRDHR